MGEIDRDGRASYHQTDLWRSSLQPAEHLTGFLEEAGAVIPAGSPTVFSSRSTSESQDFLRYLWAAYQIPQVDLMPAAGSPAADRARAAYWIAYRTTERNPALTAVWEHRDGAVYRIDR